MISPERKRQYYVHVLQNGQSRLKSQEFAAVQSARNALIIQWRCRSIHAGAQPFRQYACGFS